MTRYIKTGLIFQHISAVMIRSPLIFSVQTNTGNKYHEFTFLLRSQYDLGKKDSIVSDSTVIPLFYPRVRFEHTLQLDKNKYTFNDFIGDSLYYKMYYDTSLSGPLDTFLLQDRWKIFSNDFSIYQFPDAKNLNQFIKLGVLFQHISGELSSGNETFLNTAGHAEYRNKTRNQQWEIEANGKLFFTGFNAGDYQAHISLQRLLGKKSAMCNWVLKTQAKHLHLILIIVVVFIF